MYTDFDPWRFPATVLQCPSTFLPACFWDKHFTPLSLFLALSLYLFLGILFTLLLIKSAIDFTLSPFYTKYCPEWSINYHCYRVAFSTLNTLLYNFWQAPYQEIFVHYQSSWPSNLLFLIWWYYNEIFFFLNPKVNENVLWLYLFVWFISLNIKISTSIHV